MELEGGLEAVQLDPFWELWDSPDVSLGSDVMRMYQEMVCSGSSSQQLAAAAKKTALQLTSHKY